MAPLRGWAPRGQRLAAAVPYGHWKTLTFIAALRHDRIDAPCVIDGPINGVLFTAYVEQLLVPTLEKGDIVILDNLAAGWSQPLMVQFSLKFGGIRYGTGSSRERHDDSCSPWTRHPTQSFDDTDI